MNRRFKLVVLVLVMVLLISSMSVLLTSCNEGEQEPKDYGTFYALQEAYDLGYIDMQDLKSIAYYWSGSYEGTIESLGEDFVPTPMNPEELSDKQWDELQYAYDECMRKTYPDWDAIGNAMPNLHAYLGTYNGYIVAETDVGIGFGAQDRYVEGVLFHFSGSPNFICVWVI